ncbi:MAG TPA: tetratricopeptide repeat protein [Chitinophagales bacterium]|nr:tetratricopeptide repeat protein [Chitinophagales bacterium]
MNIKKLYIKNRLYLSIFIILLGIVIHVSFFKGYQWSWMFYVGGVILLLWDILIGPMRYIQQLVEEGDVEGAKEVIATVRFPKLLIKPVRSGYYLLQSNLDMMSEDFEQAESNIRKSLGTKSDMMKSYNGVSYLQLGAISMKKGNMKEAYSQFKEAVKLGLPDKENQATAYIQLASICVQRQDNRAAKMYFRRAKRLNPKTQELVTAIKDMEKYMSRIPG